MEDMAKYLAGTRSGNVRWLERTRDPMPDPAASADPAKAVPAASADPAKAVPAASADLKDLYNWLRRIDMQQVTHIGNEVTSECWDTFKGITLSRLMADQELTDKLYALRLQYHNFTSPAKRRRVTSSRMKL